MDPPPPPPHIPSRRWRHHPGLLHPQQTQFCLFLLGTAAQAKKQETENQKLQA